MTRRSDPFLRTKIIFAAFVVSALFSYFLIGYQLVAPVRGEVAPPGDDLALDTVRIQQPAGPTLAGWAAGPAQPEAVVVLMHPIVADRGAMLERARFLLAAGYAVLLFDFRAHGESEGEYDDPA